MPIGGRPSASGRALHTAVTTICLSGATSAAGSSRWAGSRTSRPIRRSTATRDCTTSSNGSCQTDEHGVGGGQRVAQVAGLLGVELLGLLAVARGAEIEVAGDPQQLVGGDGAARPARAVGDVGLDRAEVAAAVEDDRQRVAQRQPADPERDRS